MALHLAADNPHGAGNHNALGDLLLAVYEAMICFASPNGKMCGVGGVPTARLPGLDPGSIELIGFAFMEGEWQAMFISWHREKAEHYM